MNSPTVLRKSTVLVVDDTPQNIKLMAELLRDEYNVLVANKGERALQLAAGENRPDLVLLDVMMPEMDGYEVIRRLKASETTRDIPVIFLTAKNEIDDETLGLSLGAVDYITKPISPPIVLARLKTHLIVKESTDFLRDQAAFLEAEVAKRNQKLEAIQDVTVLALASLAETRDNETGNHILRTQRYIRVLAEKLRENPKYAPAINDEYIKTLFKSAPLHDIGKVGIPDAVLLKPGKLTDDEFAIMKTHTRLGYEAILRAEESLGMELDFLKMSKEIALSHQEKWDGSGYPEGLAGEKIPLSARLMAVADVYDALISKRVYKPSMTGAEAAAIISKGKSTHFDPDVVDAFEAVLPQFEAIAADFSD